jgi:hypothetical protein
MMCLRGVTPGACRPANGFARERDDQENTLMTFRRIAVLVAGLAVVALGAARAGAVVLLVDDDGADCPSAPHRTIAEAVAVAGEWDQVQVCPGTYAEQVVIARKVRLVGLPDDARRVVIRPGALPESRPSLLGGKPIAAGIIVDGAEVQISRIDLDMSAAGVTTCDLLAGIYYRNASGKLRESRIEGVGVPGQPACDTGVGLYVESGVIGQNQGAPIYGKAWVTAIDDVFANNQKGAVVVNGRNAVLKMSGGEVIGDGPGAAAVQNGVQVSLDAKARRSVGSRRAPRARWRLRSSPTGRSAAP